MAFGNIYIGDNVQTFKHSPKFETIDMVILYIDETAYVSSPSVTVDTEAWEASKLGKSNGKFVFTYDADNAAWVRNGVAVSLSDYGITVGYNVTALAAKDGDVITVNRLGESATADVDYPDIDIVVELTRSGRTMEANCPLCKPANRQMIADKLLENLSGYGYQPFSATGAGLNPLAELGDGVTINGMYCGIYQQDLTFDQLMISDISAPFEEELESEFSYEDYHERTYRRRFADIAADFEIHWNEISARVTREGTGDGFSWSLIESGFSVKAGEKVIFRVDKNGTYTDGTGVFSGQIVGGSIKIGNKFSVDTDGNLVCSSAKITGGSITIGSNFKVDSNGNLTANTGTFKGTVYAGSISYGQTPGYFNGAGLSSGTVGTARLTEGVNTSLGYADFANGVFNNWNTAPYVNATYVKCNLIYLGYTSLVPSKLTFLGADGNEKTVNYVTWSEI